MALATYGDLKNAVASWLERSDLTARVPDFISLAQSRIYSGDEGIRLPPLRIAAMITSGTIAITGGVGATPAGWLQFLRIREDATDAPMLAYVPPHAFWDLPQAHYPGAPLFYTIEGSVIRTAPTSTTTLSATWFARLTAMSADSDADWIMTNAPHVYLHGALAEAFEFEGTLERAQQHTARLASAVKSLNSADQIGQTSGSVLVMRPRATP
jgi:hypothetical protein